MTSSIYSASTAHGALPLVAGGVLSFASFYEEMQLAFYDLRWALLFIIGLVLMDFWSGSACSVKIRNEDFHFSRAIRRTVVKFLEYVTYIIFGFLLAKSILVPLGLASATMGGAIGAGVALLAEADSIYDHICLLHGFKNPPSLRRIFLGIFLRRHEDVKDVLDEMKEDKAKK